MANCARCSVESLINRYGLDNVMELIRPYGWFGKPKANTWYDILVKEGDR